MVDTVHGYCCPAVNQKCPYHTESYQKSGCQGNRTGILCGSCKENFSEALFHTNCARDDECTHLWYLIVFFICAMLFAFYLIRKPPVFQKIMQMLTWFISSNSACIGDKFQRRRFYWLAFFLFHTCFMPVLYT